MEKPAPKEKETDEYPENQQSVETLALPVLYLVLKPAGKAFDILNRISRLSPAEKTAKDFIDLFGNLGLLCALGPAEDVDTAGDDAWKDLIPPQFSRLKASRETYTGKRAGQRFLLIYLVDRETGRNLPAWKELVGRIVRWFF